MYLDAVKSNDSLTNRLVTLATFFACLRLNKLKLSLYKSRISAVRIDFLVHVISQDGVRPYDDKVAPLVVLPMPTNIKPLRYLLESLSYYRKFLPNMDRRIHPITALFKKGARFDLTPAMKELVNALLAELAAPPIPVFLTATR